MFDHRCQSFLRHSNHQRGAVLIVCLVLLTILTLIGISTATDIGLQSNMVRNSQLKQTAFNLALSELEAQRDLIRREWDTTGESRTLLMAKNSPTSPISKDQEDLEMYGTSEFKQDYSYVFPGDACLRIGESSREGGRFYGDLYLLNSSASLPNTGTRSSQTLGLCSR